MIHSGAMPYWRVGVYSAGTGRNGLCRILLSIHRVITFCSLSFLIITKESDLGTPANNSVRIIGGEARGRRIAFSGAHIRPTPDRVRETLFNWLAPVVRGAHCLDAFAGTGVLGLEALSRGASFVHFIDQSVGAITQISQHIESLHWQDQCQCHQIDALQWTTSDTFDLVFIDPPYAKLLEQPCLEKALQDHWLRPNALLYCESRTSPKQAKWLQGWHVHRYMRAGLVHAYLLKQAVDGE
jgi:16S rRNA (guanine966-N2)-methyltransferase